VADGMYVGMAAAAARADDGTVMTCALCGGPIAVERLLPWRTPAVYGVAAALAVLAVWIAVDPGSLPGLTLPTAPMRLTASAPVVAAETWND